MRGVALTSAMAVLMALGPLHARAAIAPQAASWGDGVKVVQQGTRHEAWYDLYVDGPHRLAVGTFGAVRGSDDGGQTWFSSSLPTQGRALLGLTGHGQVRIAVGQSGLVFRTVDGSHWASVASGTSSRLMAVHMNSQGVVLAVGAFGTVLRSDDAGKTWRTLSPRWADITTDGAEPHLYGVRVAEDGTATLVGEFGLVLRVDPAGGAWQVLRRGEASLFGLAVAPDGKTWYAVGQGGLAISSTDDGKHWQSLTTSSQALLTRVAVSPSGAVLATGINTVLLSRDGGVSWQRVAALPSNAWLQAVVPLPSKPGRPPRAWAVGSGGAWLEFVD